MSNDSLNDCPGCGGPADNGHDRCLPPSPYFCTKCSQEKLVETVPPIGFTASPEATKVQDWGLNNGYTFLASEAQEIADLFRSEIPVNRELLLTAIYVDIEAETLGNGHPVPTETIENLAQSIMGTIEPFLAKPEPVSVHQIWEGLTPESSDSNIIRAALKAAGVPYVD